MSKHRRVDQRFVVGLVSPRRRLEDTVQVNFAIRTVQLRIHALIRGNLRMETSFIRTGCAMQRINHIEHINLLVRGHRRRHHLLVVELQLGQRIANVGLQRTPSTLNLGTESTQYMRPHHPRRGDVVLLLWNVLVDVVTGSTIRWMILASTLQRHSKQTLNHRHHRNQQTTATREQIQRYHTLIGPRMERYVRFQKHTDAAHTLGDQTMAMIRQQRQLGQRHHLDHGLGQAFLRVEEVGIDVLDIDQQVLAGWQMLLVLVDRRWIRRVVLLSRRRCIRISIRISGSTRVILTWPSVSITTRSACFIDVLFSAIHKTFLLLSSPSHILVIVARIGYGLDVQIMAGPDGVAASAILGKGPAGISGLRHFLATV
mmetsp:Transcript_20100/g.57679  ORF Transcript_20100/g.57679 Transcript_20100/m.57679 type:complete len:371 (-) Transcript_20100:442-1554(-)